MTYITNANYQQIIRKIDTRELNLKGQVYKQAIYFLNKLEVQNLLGLKELLRNPEAFANKVYQKIKKQSNPNFVYSASTPAYHETTSCEKLNSEYRNYKIPEEIKQKGQQAIYEFRVWFNNNDYLLEDNDELKVQIFKERCRLRFGLKKELEIVIHENSGALRFKYNDQKELEDKIGVKIKEAGRFYYQSKKHTAILRQFSKLAFLSAKPGAISEYKINNTGYSDKEVKELLTEYERNIKKPLINLLKHWYRVKYNPNLNFEKKVLEQLGFKQCSSCRNHSQVKFTTSDCAVNPNKIGNIYGMVG